MESEDVLLNVLDVVMKVSSDNSKILDLVKFVFREFIVPNGTINLYFKLYAVNDNAKQYHLTKESIRIKYSYNDIHYQKWDYEDTFLPPLRIYPLKNNYLVLHGCAVQSPKGKNIVFLAPSMAGKTTMTIFLLQHGYKCISDDLLFIKNGCIRSYKKPVGIRESSASVFGEDIINQWVNNSDHKTFVNENGRTTWLCHLNDIFANCFVCEENLNIDYLIIPNYNQGEFKEISSHQIITYILNSICESGISTEKTQTEITLLLRGIAKGFTLNTGNLDTSYKIIDAITN